MSRAAAPLAALLAAALAVASCSPDEVAATGRGELREDPRLAWLLGSSGNNGHYDVDTSDPVAILGEVLRHGQREPLRRARIELGNLGSAGVAAAERLIDAAWNDPTRFADIRNALDALSYAASDEAHAVVARVLRHPDPTPRQAAWRALKPMARPVDFEVLRELLFSEPPESSTELAQLLFDSDPERAIAEFLDWIENERYPGLWNDVAKAFPQTRSPESAQRACRLRQGAAPILAIQLAGACAAVGDEPALDFLRERLRDELPGAREVAMGALIESGHVEELAWTLQNDPLPAMRARAAGVIAGQWPPELAEPLLTAGIADPDWGVSWACLNALVERGQPEAVERAIGRLGSDEAGVLEQAVLSLRPRMLVDEALSERVYEVLARREREEQWLDLSQRITTLRAIGLAACRPAALHLVEASRDVAGEVQGVDAERWILQQIGNTGDPGQVVLIEELASERDPHRRLDLIEALAAVPSARSSAWLLERAAAEDVDPWELLYVAERLTRVGPTARVAPVLKRAVLRVQQSDVRRALQAMLWTWYPAPAR